MNEREERAERLPREVASKVWSMHCRGKSLTEIVDELCVPRESVLQVITRCWSEMDERPM